MPANAKPRTELVKRARAERILSMRAAGATQEQVARALDCSVETIRRTERWAEENGLLEEAQNRFIKMLKKSARVYEERLDDSKQNPKLALEAARDIAFGTGVLKKTHNQTGAVVAEEESLTLILKRRRERLTAANEGSDQGGRGDEPRQDPPAEAPEEVVEGFVERSFGAAADGEELFPNDGASGSR